MALRAFEVLAVAAALATGGSSAAAQGPDLTWTPVMTHERPSTYFNYYDRHPDEFPGVELQPAYEFPSDTIGCRPSDGCEVSCTFRDEFPWFVNAGGSDLTGTHPHRNPSSGNVSTEPETSVRGIQFVGSFAGSATGPASDFLYQVVFFHQQKCYLGGTEYGFVRNVLNGAFQFYWAINSNCGLDDPASTPARSSACRSERAGGARVQESSGAISIPYSSGTNKYEAFIAFDEASGQWGFVVRVFEPANSATPWVAWVNPNEPGYWFPAPADPGARFPIADLVDATGYLTIGIQRSGLSTEIVPDPASLPALRTQSLSVGRMPR